MFAARQGFFSTQIVTENLQLYLDPGNPLSYSGSGTTWSNLMSTSFDLTLQNGVTYSSDVGGCFDFDGTDDYADRTAALDVSASFSGMMWFYSRAAGTTKHGIISNGWAYNILQRGWVAYHGFANRSSGILMDIGADTAYYGTNANTFPINVWTCFFFRRLNPGGGGSWQVWRNGVQSGSNFSGGTGPNNGISYATNVFYIGRANEGVNDYYFNGKVGEVFLWNRYLSVAEIGTMFNATRGRYGI